MFKANNLVGQVPTLHVMPMLKKLRIAHAKLSPANRKLSRFAHILGIAKHAAANNTRARCNLPGLPNKLLSTVFSKPVRYFSGVSIYTHF